MKIKINCFIILIAIIVSSCKDEKYINQDSEQNQINSSIAEKDLKYHLSNGMKELDNNVGMSDSLSKDVYLKSFAFYENDVNKYTLILELNYDITDEIVNKYTFGFETHVFEKDKELLLPYSKSKNRLYDLRPFKPELTSVNGHKYVLSDVNLEIKIFEKLVFYLYPRSGYAGKLAGKRLELLDYSL